MRKLGLNLFIQRRGKIIDQTLESVEGIRQRDHSYTHGAVAEFISKPSEVFSDRDKLRQTRLCGFLV